MATKRFRMLVRIPFVAMIITTLFWGVWYLIAGKLPATANGFDVVCVFPRWPDPIFAGLWAWILSALFSSPSLGVRHGRGVYLLAGLLVGLATTQCIGSLVSDPTRGVEAGILLSSLYACHEYAERHLLLDVLTTILSSGLGIGLYFGHLSGLGNGLIVAGISIIAMGCTTCLLLSLWYLGKLIWMCGSWIFSNRSIKWMAGN